MLINIQALLAFENFKSLNSNLKIKPRGQLT